MRGAPAIAACIAAASTAAAQSPEVMLRGLTVMHHNQLTFDTPDDEDFSFHLPDGQGVVRLRLHRESNAKCPMIAGGCPDRLEVIDLPIGWRAEPWGVETPERERSIIVLHPYIAG